MVFDSFKTNHDQKAMLQIVELKERSGRNWPIVGISQLTLEYVLGTMH